MSLATLLSLVQVLLPLVAAAASEEDIVAARVAGNFRLYNAAGGVDCADTITIQDELQVSDKQQSVYRVPHASIQHGSDVCATKQGSTSSTMDIYVSDPTKDIKEVARIMPSVVQVGALFARDESGRVCGSWEIPETSVFVFFTPRTEFKFDENILKRRKIDSLPPKQDYMLVVFPYGNDRTGDGNPVCVYQKKSAPLSAEKLATIPYNGAEVGNGNQEVDASSTTEGKPDSDDESWWTTKHIAVVAGAASAVLLAVIVVVGVLVICRRRRASENAYYQFDARSSVRNSGSVTGVMPNKPSSLMTPWQIRRSRKALAEADDEAPQTALEDRPEVPVTGRRGVVPMRESIDSSISSEIAAPMMSPLEIQRLSTQANGVGSLDDTRANRAGKNGSKRPTFRS